MDHRNHLWDPLCWHQSNLWWPSVLGLWHCGLVLFSAMAKCNTCTINHLFCCLGQRIKSSGKKKVTERYLENSQISENQTIYCYLTLGSKWHGLDWETGTHNGAESVSAVSLPESHVAEFPRPSVQPSRAAGSSPLTSHHEPAPHSAITYKTPWVCRSM